MIHELKDFFVSPAPMWMVWLLFIMLGVRGK